MKTKTEKKEKTVKPEELKPIVKGIKGYNKNMTCRDHQYKIGESYETKGKVKACETGFHFCEHPMDVFSYYPPGTSTYTEVEGTGEVSRDGSDSKVAVSHIKIGAEISLKKIIESSIKLTFEKVKWTKECTSNGDLSGATSNGYKSGATSNGYKSGATSNGNKSGATSNGDLSGATSNGDLSGATSNGDLSGATSNGYKSGATSNGDNSGATSNGNLSGATSNGDNSTASAGKGCVAMALGYNSKARGKIGSWIVISECEIIKYITYLKDVKSFKVDGVVIKEDTFYKLVNGEVIESL